MRKRNYLNSTSFYILICLFVGWANMQTLQAKEPIDTLVFTINNDYVSTLPNESVEIFSLQNDIYSKEKDPNGADLLNALNITDFTQPEFGNVNFQDNYFVSCCCDDFVSMIQNSPISANITGTTATFTPPSGIQTNDAVYWDFDCDGTDDLVSQGNGTVSWTYPSPGSCNYVACMTAEHIQADGDTCRAKQTKFVTIDENCESCLHFDGSDRISVPNLSLIHI